MVAVAERPPTQEDRFVFVRISPPPPESLSPIKRIDEWHEYKLSELVGRLNPLFKRYYNRTLEAAKDPSNTKVIGAVTIDLDTEPPDEIVESVGLKTHPSIYFDYLIEDWSKNNGKKDKHIGFMDDILMNPTPGYPIFKQPGFVLQSYGEDIARLPLVTASNTHGAARYGSLAVVKEGYPPLEMKLAILLTAAQTSMRDHDLPSRPEDFPHFRYLPTNSG